MTPDTDPGLWKQLSGWLWGVLAVPLAMLWRKADNAVPREEMREHLADDKETHAEFRETMKTLFTNAERDRAVAAQHHVDLVQLIHEKFGQRRE